MSYQGCDDTALIRHAGPRHVARLSEESGTGHEPDGASRFPSAGMRREPGGSTLASFRTGGHTFCAIIESPARLPTPRRRQWQRLKANLVPTTALHGYCACAGPANPPMTIVTAALRIVCRVNCMAGSPAAAARRPSCASLQELSITQYNEVPGNFWQQEARAFSDRPCETPRPIHRVSSRRSHARGCAAGAERREPTARTRATPLLRSSGRSTSAGG